ncbi:MAG: GNAT family N-acetyltransferase [Patescibacteria group bacterium]
MASQVEGFKVSEDAPYFWSEEQLAQWIFAEEDVLLGAELNGKLVGFILTTHHRPTGKVTWENQLVLSGYRGQGIGEALMLEMRKRLRLAGATYLCGLVRTNNTDGSRYYASRGMNRGHDFVWLEETL